MATKILSFFLKHIDSQNNWVLKHTLILILLLLPVFSVQALSIPKDFDHFKTNFVLNGAHQRTKCLACHRGTKFQGTPLTCEGCHSIEPIALSQLPPTHINVGGSCDDCHTENRWKGARVDHALVTGTCFTCHNGRDAVGKSPKHIDSNNLCEDCHRTIIFKGGKFNHDGITAICTGCHNGVNAKGKGPTHTDTNAMCDVCHSTRAWKPVNFVHDANTTNCFRCHNGTTATGAPKLDHTASTNCEDCHRVRAWKPATFSHATVTKPCKECHQKDFPNSGHVPIIGECGACHSRKKWKPITSFDHDAVTTRCTTCHNGVLATGLPRDGHVPISPTGNCDDCHKTNRWQNAHFSHRNFEATPCLTCHNGSIATAKGSRHFVTTLNCNSCHLNTSSWSRVRYAHSGNYPDHGARLSCKSCHQSNNSTIRWQDAGLAPDCAGCHRNDYRPGPHKGASVVQLKDCAGACHKPGPEHRPTDRKWD